MLRPLPDKTNTAALAKLGWLTSLANARRDALAQLRDCVTRLNVAVSDEDIQASQEAIARLKQIKRLEGEE